ncbi:hypothetical protein I3J27_19200 [Bradyrhizobium xenonodulans]|uniref:Uncharacterized protein n=1 Tax=Bradyrhizobium xenonodulans TaxID=2736875 RepID=A0ABY7MY07_9BRAD|nr:hypothetical protein [Bradyrhizobium xenonodulans]WBL82449.1 hypothetical protein I3J27_19200 [Bradyrhizobium xenonodulans]
MSNIIDLVPDRSEVNIERHHAQAFRDLETSLRGCVRMSAGTASRPHRKRDRQRLMTHRRRLKR